MVFFMPCLRKQLSLYLLIAYFLPLQLSAKNINFSELMISNEEDFYTLSTKIMYELNEETLKALEHGIGLNISIDIYLFKKNKSWFEAPILKRKLIYLLEYHTLTNQYLLTNFDTGIRKSFSSLESALNQLGTLNNIQLWNQTSLDKSNNYYFSLNSTVEIRSLPAPLRPLMYLSNKWRMRGDEFKQDWQP